MRRSQPSTGLEGAPDVMLLALAAVMVAVVWLVSHVHEATLPQIDLPSSEASRLGSSGAASINVTLRLADTGAPEVWVEDAVLPDGIDGLKAALDRSEVPAITLRADAGTRWEDALRVMTIAAQLGRPVNIAADQEK